jgi:hypothetical protein
MLGELIKELTKLKSEIDSVDFQSIPEDQRIQRLNELAEQVLKTLDNAHVEIPEEYQSNSGEQI